eukprot:614895-Alexandrium_andersonii.AAC.1
MSAIRASRLPAELDPDQPLRQGNVWTACSDCEACSVATGRVATRLVNSRAEAVLASDCSARQA